MNHLENVFYFLYNNINLTEKNFIEAISLTLLSLISHMFFPHLQYKYKLVSKMTMTEDDMGRGADFLAFFLIHIGTFRNYAFFETLFTNKRIEVSSWYYTVIVPLGIIFIILGVTLVIFSFKSLGLRGMYFGDHFGFLFKRRVDKFPFNYLENPQYVGSNFIYLGLSLVTRSLAGLVLSIFIVMTYRMFYVLFEKSKLKIFYEEIDSDPKLE